MCVAGAHELPKERSTTFCPNIHVERACTMAVNYHRVHFLPQDCGVVPILLYYVHVHDLLV